MSTDKTEVKAALDETVQRFLNWKLPLDLHPDCGISFKPIYNERSPYGPSRHEPIGTNLFSADQAREMLEHVCAPLIAALAATLIDGVPAVPHGSRIIKGHVVEGCRFRPALTITFPPIESADGAEWKARDDLAEMLAAKIAKGGE